MMRWQPDKSSSTGQHIILSEEKEFLLTFLKSEGISYIVPGRKDQVYIGKGPDGQHMYKPKYYLLWTLREVQEMLNEELYNENSLKSRFKETLKFSSFYHFIKENKEIYYQQKIPQLTCLCEKCENFELLREGIKRSETSLNLLSTSVHAVLPKFCCNYHEETCAFETCRDCPGV